MIRANNLSRSKPGRKLYSVDEMYKRVFQCDINKEGLLTNPQVIIEEGDFRVKKFDEKSMLVMITLRFIRMES